MTPVIDDMTRTEQSCFFRLGKTNDLPGFLFHLFFALRFVPLPHTGFYPSLFLSCRSWGYWRKGNTGSRRQHLSRYCILRTGNPHTTPDENTTVSFFILKDQQEDAQLWLIETTSNKGLIWFSLEIGFLISGPL